jgi:hypothetical protein
MTLQRLLVEKRTDDEVPHIISERTHQSFSKNPTAFGNRLFQRYRRKAAIELYSKRISLALVRWSYPKLLTKDRTEKAIH